MGGRKFLPEWGWSENPREKGPGEDPVTYSPVLAREDQDLSAALGKGALGVGVSSASPTLPGKALLSPNCPAGTGAQQGLLVYHSCPARHPRARQTCRGFPWISVTHRIHMGTQGLCGGGYQLLGRGLMSLHFGPSFWSVAVRGPTVQTGHPFPCSSVIGCPSLANYETEG